MRLPRSLSGDHLTLLVLLTISLALNVRLGLQVQQLRRAAPIPVAPPLFVKGAPLPDLPLLDLAGAELPRTARQPDNRPTLLYLFSPSCRWCRLNSPSVDALYRQTRATTRFVGVALQRPGLDEYLVSQHVGFAVYVLAPRADVLRTRVGGVPQTILVGPNGAILDTWNGAYLGDTKQAIETRFNAQLPDLWP
jgi:hypothetical protein